MSGGWWGDRTREGGGGGRESSGEGTQAGKEGDCQWSRGGANLACPVLQVWLFRLPFLNHCLDHFLFSLQGEEPSHHLPRPPGPEAVPCAGSAGAAPGTAPPTAEPSPGAGPSAVAAAPCSPHVGG